MNRIVLFFFIFLLLFSIPSIGFSENIRGKLSASLSLENSSSDKVTMDTLVSIDPKGAKEYLQALEVEIQVPSQIRQYRDSFALYLYGGITPEPEDNIRSYSGKRLLFQVLPSTAKLYIRIPVSPSFTPENVPGTIDLKEVQDLDSFPLLFTILPVMKGIPNSLYSTYFSVTLRPLYAKLGKVQLSLSSRGGETAVDPGVLTLYMDDQKIPYPKDFYELPVGIHDLRVESEVYENVQISFGLDEGQNKKVSIDLVKRTPYLYIEGPKEADVFLDGEKIDYVSGKKLATSSGEHVVLFKIGDYSISKKFQIADGKTYKISLFFDIFVQEN